MWTDGSMLLLYHHYYNHFSFLSPTFKLDLKVVRRYLYSLKFFLKGCKD